MSEASRSDRAGRRAASLRITPLQGLPLFRPGMSVAQEIVAASVRQRMPLAAGDVVVVAQKIVSKAEGRQVDLRDVVASERWFEDDILGPAIAITKDGFICLADGVGIGYEVLTEKVAKYCIRSDELQP